MSSSPEPTDGGWTRRDLLRRGGAVAGGATVTTTVGSRTVPQASPVGRAAAVAPAIPIGIIGGAAAVKYVTGKTVGEHAIDLVTGDDRDYSGYTGADALHNEIETGATEMQSADERVMTGIENNIENADNVALSKGKAAIIEEMNAENSESDAQDAMQEAIDDYFATIQTNIVNHWNQQQQQIAHHMEQVEVHEDLSLSDVFERINSVDDPDGWESVTEFGGLFTSEYDLLNGESIEVDHIEFVGGDGEYSYYFDPFESFDEDATSDDTSSTEGWSPENPIYAIAVQPSDGSDRVEYLERGAFLDPIETVVDRRDSVNSDLSGFVTDVYDSYEPGDIPTETLVDPITAATELRQDYDNMSGQGAHAAMLGIPTSAEMTADLEIQSDEADDGVWEVEADIFTSHVPREDLTESASIDADGVLTLTTEPADGATVTIDTADDETVDVDAGDFSESSDGDEWTVDLSGDLDTADTSADRVQGEKLGFESGETYSPGDWDAPLYITYEYVDEQTGEKQAEFTQIESEFTIVSVTDSDGEEVDNFQTRSRNNQTADVSALQDELEQLREEDNAMQEEAQEQDGGGGGIIGDWFGDSSGAGGPLIGALVVLGAIVGFGQLTS